MNVLKFKTTKERDLLMNKQENEMAYCADTDKVYIYHEKTGWDEVPGEMKASGSFEINYRDMLMNTIKDFEPVDIIAKYGEKIAEWARKHITDEYMLYAKEIGYFTVFEMGDAAYHNERMIPVLGECLNALGDVIYVESNFDTDKQIIFWVRDKENKLFEAYLFDCSPLYVRVGGID